MLVNFKPSRRWLNFFFLFFSFGLGGEKKKHNLWAYLFLFFSHLAHNRILSVLYKAPTYTRSASLKYLCGSVRLKRFRLIDCCFDLDSLPSPILFEVS